MLSSFRGHVMSGCRRLFSTNAAASASIPIPGNLQLADGGRILEAEKPNKKVQISEEEMWYPPLKMAVPQLPVKSWEKPGELIEGKQVELDPRVFNVAIRQDIVHEMIRFQRAKVRQPHRTKRVGEISGSTRKPHPQKKGGKSQAGNTRNSSWRKGMKAHGPVLRDFAFSLNKKERARALMTVLAAMHRQGDIVVFDSFDMPDKKSKALLTKTLEHGLLPTSSADSEAVGPRRKVMLCDDFMSANMVYAARNLQDLILMPQIRINVHDLMHYDVLAISSRALNSLQARLYTQWGASPRDMFNLKQHTIMTHAAILEHEERQELAQDAAKRAANAASAAGSA